MANVVHKKKNKGEKPATVLAKSQKRLKNSNRKRKTQTFLKLSIDFMSMSTHAMS